MIQDDQPGHGNAAPINKAERSNYADTYVIRLEMEQLGISSGNGQVMTGGHHGNIASQGLHVCIRPMIMIDKLTGEPIEVCPPRSRASWNSSIPPGVRLPGTHLNALNI